MGIDPEEVCALARTCSELKELRKRNSELKEQLKAKQKEYEELWYKYLDDGRSSRKRKERRCGRAYPLGRFMLPKYW